MKNQFVTHEIALQMKELGFNEPCFTGFLNTNKALMPSLIDSIEKTSYINSKLTAHACTAPLWQQAIDWMRETHDFYIDVYPCHQDLCKFRIISTITGNTKLVSTDASLYNKMRREGILAALEFIKEKTLKTSL